MYIPWFKPEPLAIPLPDIGPLPDDMYVHPFGALVAVAVLVGTHVASKRARQEGLHPRVFGEFSAYLLIGGFVLGHMLDAVFYHWDVVRLNPLFVLQLWNGLSSFGGFIGAMTGGVIWLLVRGYPLIPFADVVAYAAPFGWIFGRLGCFIVHDHPGAITDFPLAVADYQVAGGLPPFQVRHDLGFYEVLWCLAVIPLFLYLGRRKRPRGFYAVLLPVIYAPVRFGLDFLRATDVTNGDPRILFGLTPGHFGAVLLFAAGLAIAFYIRGGRRFRLPRDVRWTAEDEGRPDDRGVEALLETLDAPRGSVRVTAPSERTDGVERWPGGVLLIEARGVEDWPRLAEHVDALGPERVHVWQVEDLDEATAEALREIIAAHPATERDVAVTDGDPDAAAASLGIPVWVQKKGDEAPYAILERDDGGAVFGMLGEPAAG